MLWRVFGTGHRELRASGGEAISSYRVKGRTTAPKAESGMSELFHLN